MQQNRQDRSLGELFGDLAKETSDLVREEVSLAKTELTQKAASMAKDIGFLAVGGAIAYAGLLALLAALIIGLSQLGVAWWLSALIVGLIVAAVGYFLVQKGLSALKGQNLAPSNTIATIKEDVEWAKDRTR